MPCGPTHPLRRLRVPHVRNYHTCPPGTRATPPPSSASGSRQQQQTIASSACRRPGPPLDTESSGRLITNLDKVREKRPLNPREQADYDQAQRIVAGNTAPPQPGSPGQPSATTSSSGSHIPDTTTNGGNGDNTTATHTVDGGGGDGNGPTFSTTTGGDGDGSGSTSSTSSTHSSSGSLPPGASSSTTGHATPSGIDSGTPPTNPPGVQPSTTDTNGQPPSTSPSGQPSRPSAGKPPNTPKPNPPLDVEGSRRLIANLDKERAHHPLHEQKEADYGQARQVVAKDTVERLQKQTTPLTDAQKQEMADALNTLGADSSAPGTPDTNSGTPDRAPQPGGTNPRGVELPGGRRSGGPHDSYLVLAGGSDGPKPPLQGGAAATLPLASAGNQLPAAVGQMVNGSGGDTNPDVPKASAGGDTQGPQPSQPPAPLQPPPATDSDQPPQGQSSQPSTSGPGTSPAAGGGAFPPKLGTLRAPEALDLREFAPEHAKQITDAMHAFESAWGISFPIATKKPVRKQAKGGVYVPGGDAIYVGIDDPANNTVHEVSHWLHDRLTKFGFEEDHRWKPTKQYAERFPLSTNPETRKRQIERHEAITELWKAIESTESHQDRMKDMRARKPAKQLKELAKPREIFARTVERVTAHLAGRKQPSYSSWNFYTTLTKTEMEALIPYVRRYLRSLGEPGEGKDIQPASPPSGGS